MDFDLELSMGLGSEWYVTNYLKKTAQIDTLCGKLFCSKQSNEHHSSDYFQITYISFSTTFMLSALLYVPIIISVGKFSYLISARRNNPQKYIFWQTFNILIFKLVWSFSSVQNFHVPDFHRFNCLLPGRSWTLWESGS